MKKIAKLIFLVVICILSVVLLGVVMVSEKYTDSDVEKVVEKAELVSQDFSYIVSCDEIVSMKEKYDPINQRTTKNVEFRISSGYVLDAEYDENDKIISSEIVYHSSVGNRLSVIGIVMIFSGTLFFIFWTVSDLVEQHRERKEEDEEDDDEDREQTVYEKRKFLWF